MMNNNWPWPTAEQLFNWPFPTVKPEEDSTTKYANSKGVRFMHLQGNNIACTVAYRPTTNYKNSQVLEVAVTYKHKNDQYNRKIGAEIVAKRFMEGKTMLLPIRGKTNKETMQNISAVFLDTVDRIKDSYENNLFW